MYYVFSIHVLTDSFLLSYSGFRWTLSQFIMQKADMGMKSPLDMMYFSQPWMFVTVFPISLILEGKWTFITLIDSKNWQKIRVYLIHYT